MICTSMESPANPTPTHFQNEPAKIDLKAILEYLHVRWRISFWQRFWRAHRGFKIRRLQSNDS